jgi:hypothetical protein
MKSHRWWRSFDTVEYATLEWVDWFNNRRLLEPIGNIPPAEAEKRYHWKASVSKNREFEGCLEQKMRFYRRDLQLG